MLLEFGYTLLDSLKKKIFCFFMKEDLVVHFGGSSMQSMTIQKKKRKKENDAIENGLIQQ